VDFDTLAIAFSGAFSSWKTYAALGAFLLGAFLIRYVLYAGSVKKTVRRSLFAKKPKVAPPPPKAKSEEAQEGEAEE
jgi:hypothetical protein